MNINEINPARKFVVGSGKKITINHCANIDLEENEQVTFVSDNDTELDLVRKCWGYYVTPSINKRLLNFGFSTYVVSNDRGNIYIMAVEQNRDLEFRSYLTETNQKIIINLGLFHAST